MIPAIDDYKDNVDLCQSGTYMGNTLTLYTTLAHEGVIRTFISDGILCGNEPGSDPEYLNFGGYVEGWAYAEMCSYSLWRRFRKRRQFCLQKNSSILLGLYTLADIGIHYHGWSRADLSAFFLIMGSKIRRVTDRIYDPDPPERREII